MVTKMIDEDDDVAWYGLGRHEANEAKTKMMKRRGEEMGLEGSGGEWRRRLRCILRGFGGVGGRAVFGSWRGAWDGWMKGPRRGKEEGGGCCGWLVSFLLPPSISHFFFSLLIFHFPFSPIFFSLLISTLRFTIFISFELSSRSHNRLLSPA